MGKTEGSTRIYTCKRCGGEIKEPIKSWQKKPQKQKNICPFCIGKERLARQTTQERRADFSFGSGCYWNLWR